MSTPPDPFVIAAEHIAWCVREGLHPSDFFIAVGEPLPPQPPSWQQAIWLAARIASMASERLADDKVTIWPPFKKKDAA